MANSISNLITDSSVRRMRIKKKTNCEVTKKRPRNTVNFCWPELLKWTEVMWNAVLWSDESSFQICF